MLNLWLMQIMFFLGAGYVITLEKIYEKLEENKWKKIKKEMKERNERVEEANRKIDNSN